MGLLPLQFSFQGEHDHADQNDHSDQSKHADPHHHSCKLTNQRIIGDAVFLISSLQGSTPQPMQATSSSGFLL